MRKLNWAIALQNQITEFNQKQFEWGTHDCCTFAADCVLAMTGHDKMAKYRGGYKSLLGAQKKINKAGGLEAAITAELGEPKQATYAKRGDVIYFISPLGATAGICVGSRIAAPAISGIAYTPISEAIFAWDV